MNDTAKPGARAYQHVIQVFVIHHPSICAYDLDPARSPLVWSARNWTLVRSLDATNARKRGALARKARPVAEAFLRAQLRVGDLAFGSHDVARTIASAAR